MTRIQKPVHNRMLLIYGTLAVVLIIMIIFAVKTRKPQPTGDTVQFDLTGQPVLGQENAPVTVVVIEDFKCPNCKRFEEEMLPQIKTAYVDTGKAKIVNLNFPFLSRNMGLPIDDSQLAAEAVECAYMQGGSEAYRRLQQLILSAQGPENVVWATSSRLKTLAGSVDGLNDLSQFDTCLDNHQAEGAVAADVQQVQNAGVTGTPAVYVNGNLLPNYDSTTVGAAIDAAIATTK